ncbi:hypothetical protein AX16_002754 [Volvariella volvacea WC 439]|nr:hypothetical protein AX16_002754 [Volvariella volvacea WC 439]
MSVSGFDITTMTEFPVEFAVLTVSHLRYGIAAAYTLQIYELFTFFTDEVELIHGSRWSSVKIAYLLCRYYPLIAFPILMWAYMGNYSPQYCQPIIQPVHALFAPFQVFPQAVMMIRAYAFADRKSGALVVLLSAFSGLIGISIWVFCTGVSVLPDYWYNALGDTGCFSNYDGDVMGVRLGLALLASTLMDFLSMSIVIWHCVKALSRRWSWARHFIRQGLAYFATVSVVNAIAAILYFQPTSTYRTMGLPFAFTVCNLVACRLILELREKADQATQANGYAHAGEHSTGIYSFGVSNNDSGPVIRRTAQAQDPWHIESP